MGAFAAVFLSQEPGVNIPAMLLAAIFLIASVFWIRYGTSVAFSARVTDEGLEGRSLNGRRWSLAWTDVEAVRTYQNSTGEVLIVVPRKRSRTVRLAEPMSDFEDLAETVRDKTSHARREKARLRENW